jgi:hypothetical protein
MTLHSVLVDMDLMARSGGIRTLMHVLAEGPLELGQMISSAFLYIVDFPKTREYLIPGQELEVRPTSTIFSEFVLMRMFRSRSPSSLMRMARVLSISIGCKGRDK